MGVTEHSPVGLYLGNCPKYGVPVMIKVDESAVMGRRVKVCSTRAAYPCDEACLRTARQIN